MTQINKELMDFVSEPKRLPTAYAIAAWLDADGPKSKAPAEATALLRNAEDLATACKIRDTVAAVEMKAFGEFWINVDASLRQLMVRSGVKGWRVEFEPPADGERGWITLRPATDAVKMADMFQVSTEHLIGPSDAHESGYFGVWKGPANGDEPRLAADLKASGFKTHSNWIGWKWYETEGLPDFLRSRETVIQLNADNHTEDKPLANAIAQTLWQLFDLHRPALEGLNRRVHKISF